MKLSDDEVKAAAASHSTRSTATSARLREGAVLSPDERVVAADYLDGKHKRETHRPKGLTTEMKWCGATQA